MKILDVHTLHGNPMILRRPEVLFYLDCILSLRDRELRMRSWCRCRRRLDFDFEVSCRRRSSPDTPLTSDWRMRMFQNVRKFSNLFVYSEFLDVPDVP